MKNKDLKIYSDPFNSIWDGFGDLAKYLDGLKDIEYPYNKSNKTVGQVNLSSDEKQYSLEVTAPGFTKEELSIELKDNILNIKGEHSTEVNESDKSYTRREFSRSSFTRSFTVPENASGEIDAKFENGILYIDLKKKELPPKDESKKISIK